MIAAELFQRGERVAFDEPVDVGEGRRHPRRQRCIAGRRLERVHPDELVGHPVEAFHLRPQQGGIAPDPSRR